MDKTAKRGRIALAGVILITITYFGYGVAMGFKNAEALRQAKVELCRAESTCCGQLNQECIHALDELQRHIVARQ